jgi:hypothetical protein
MFNIKTGKSSRTTRESYKKNKQKLSLQDRYLPLHFNTNKMTKRNIHSAPLKTRKSRKIGTIKNKNNLITLLPVIKTYVFFNFGKINIDLLKKINTRKDISKLNMDINDIEKIIVLVMSATAYKNDKFIELIQILMNEEKQVIESYIQEVLDGYILESQKSKLLTGGNNIKKFVFTLFQIVLTLYYAMNIYSFNASYQSDFKKFISGELTESISSLSNEAMTILNFATTSGKCMTKQYNPDSKKKSALAKFALSNLAEVDRISFETLTHAFNCLTDSDFVNELNKNPESIYDMYVPLDNVTITIEIDAINTELVPANKRNQPLDMQINPLGGTSIVIKNEPNKFVPIHINNIFIDNNDNNVNIIGRQIVNDNTIKKTNELNKQLLSMTLYEADQLLKTLNEEDMIAEKILDDEDYQIYLKEKKEMVKEKHQDIAAKTGSTVQMTKQESSMYLFGAALVETFVQSFFPRDSMTPISDLIFKIKKELKNYHFIIQEKSIRFAKLIDQSVDELHILNEKWNVILNKTAEQTNGLQYVMFTIMNVFLYFGSKLRQIKQDKYIKIEKSKE